MDRELIITIRERQLLRHSIQKGILGGLVLGGKIRGKVARVAKEDFP